MALFDTIRIDPTYPGYHDSTGKYFEGGSKPTWTELLKSKILIVDIDTRIPTGKNEILNPDKRVLVPDPLAGSGAESTADPDETEGEREAAPL